MRSWIYETNFFLKSYHVKSATFQTYSNKSYPKRVYILFVIKLQGILTIKLKNYNKMLVTALVNLIIQIESKIQDL
jgi:hypothetical protein